MSKTILIMAGGTGGHIFPALAIAKALKAHSVNVEWLGSKHGMENTLVPKHNIKIHSVNAVGLRGKSP
jgi:UDP-N-acetylglucosamine--N-acetylmuramyl-(pentapeptide) pyrophosphoryl-undecaprenol N-acetylglucosamine transferase